MQRETTAPGRGLTQRGDNWWLQPLLVVLGLGAFVVYSTWAALVGTNYEWGPYLSPFYSPLLKPRWWPFSPAILILWVPLGFRLTCYYYRKVYYRSFFWDPPACAVGEPRQAYHGERRFPFILQNLHRYFLYLAVIVLGFLWYDAFRAFFFEDGVGLGVGTIVLVLNALLLSFYTFSCHSVRHLVGGCLDCLAERRVRYGLWRLVSRGNENHALWAWISLGFVAFADLYVRLVASGVITDWRLV